MPILAVILQMPIVLHDIAALIRKVVSTTSGHHEQWSAYFDKCGLQCSVFLAPLTCAAPPAGPLVYIPVSFNLTSQETRHSDIKQAGILYCLLTFPVRFIQHFTRAARLWITIIIQHGYYHVR